MNFSTGALAPEYACGVAVIDEQHRKLLLSVQMLQEQVGSNASRANLSILLSEFLRDLDLHFKTEEALIEIIDSDDARAHMAEHAAYLRQVEIVYGMLMMRNEVDWPTFLADISASLREHIGERDVPLYREVRLRLQQNPKTVLQ